MPSPQSISVCAVNASERDMIVGTLPQKMVSEALCARARSSFPETILKCSFLSYFQQTPN